MSLNWRTPRAGWGFVGAQIAIKVVKRELLKGKFSELLENEIRVLRTCNNDNIIKLYDIKKTANNFYLIMEYCNEGDLHQYLKAKKHLCEDEAVEYFVQILHAFQTLVKNKIMHRDFKLANILKHNGNIKIADFGFSKLLSAGQDLTSTMLGSPLNMAPEGATSFLPAYPLRCADGRPRPKLCVPPLPPAPAYPFVFLLSPPPCSA